MAFDLELDMSGLTNPIRKFCMVCQIEMVPVGVDRQGGQSFQCPRCKVIYYEE